MKTRSFKLVKKYPNSENIGSIWTKTPKTKNYWYMNCYLDPADVENNPEFFEEIIEKEYQILKIKTNSTRICDCIDYGNEYVTALLNSEHTSIYSIKRLSDNEVFSLGDELVDTFNRNHGKFTLKEIEFEKAPADKGTGKLSFVHTHPILGKYIPLERLEKSKPVLFVTEDGVNAYKDDNLHWVIREKYAYELRIHEAHVEGSLKNSDVYKVFFSKEKAEEYIILNKPLLSINDLLDFLEHKTSKPLWNWDRTTPSFERDIRELVKSRL